MSACSTTVGCPAALCSCAVCTLCTVHCALCTAQCPADDLDGRLYSPHSGPTPHCRLATSNQRQLPNHTIHTIRYQTIPYHTIPYHTIPDLTQPYYKIPYTTLSNQWANHTIRYHTLPCQNYTSATEAPNTKRCCLIFLQHQVFTT